MTSVARSLQRGWLGIPVRIVGDDPGVMDLLRTCYSLYDGSGCTGEAVEARCRPTRDGFEIDVDGRAPATAGDRVGAVRTLNHELSQALMLRRRDLFFVHAGVVIVDDRVVALPGVSRAGKSTLVLALIERGAAFLSDELLVFDPAADAVLASPRAPKIRDECLAWFPHLRERFVGEGESRFLPPGELGAIARRAALPLAAVVAPRWSPRPGASLTTVGRGRGLLELASSALNFGSHRSISIDHLERLVRGASCFSLDWHDPGEAADDVVEAVRRGSP